jgi:transglutaminase-like putative cysteine protease
MSEQVKKSPSNKERWWDPFSAFLLILIILTSATRLEATKWIFHLGLVQNVAILGAIAGLALGKSKFSRKTAFLFALVYGIYVISWQLGLTMGEGIEWRERIFSIFGRSQMVIRAIITQRDVKDNLFFLMLMSSLYWILGTYAGYQLVRYGNVWRAILPCGLAAFAIHAFDPLLFRRTWYLAAYLLLSLILLARMSFQQQRRKWEIEQIHIPPDVGLDLGRIALTVSVILVMIAWNTPALGSSVSSFSEVYSKLNRPWLTFKDRISFMFASLRASVGLASDYYGNEERLGLGSPKSNTVVMTIQAPKYPYLGARYYWRARVYDKYQDGVWKTTLLSTKPYAPDKDYFKQESISGRFDATFQIAPYNSVSTLFMASQPVWASRPGQLQFGLNPDGSMDMVALDARPYIRPGEYYQSRSSLASFTQFRLRATNKEYPQWVLDRYLQLPDNITQRTRDLASQIALGHDNEYDIVEAVTNYLRENIEYQTSIEAPPKNQEVIDWFLFDYKKGFCNYYATAEVILLRSLGIPARWSVGYAEGERGLTEEELTQPRRGGDYPETTSMDIVSFTVRQKDAHSWPEVYFPGSGWVEFEPTVSQSPLIRPSGESSQPSSSLDSAASQDRQPLEPTPQIPEDSRDRDANTSQFKPINPWLAAFMVVGFLGLVLGIFIILARNRQSRVGMWWQRVNQEMRAPFPVQIEKGIKHLGFQPPTFIKRWANYASLPILGRAYQEINRALLRLNELPESSATPRERVEILAKTLPEAADPAHSLLRDYERGTYSLHPVDAFIAQRSGEEIRRLSRLARIQNWIAGLSKKEKKLPSSS